MVKGDEISHVFYKSFKFLQTESRWLFLSLNVYIILLFLVITFLNVFFYLNFFFFWSLIVFLSGFNETNPSIKGEKNKKDPMRYIHCGHIPSSKHLDQALLLIEETSSSKSLKDGCDGISVVQLHSNWIWNWLDWLFVKSIWLLLSFVWFFGRHVYASIRFMPYWNLELTVE